MKFKRTWVYKNRTKAFGYLSVAGGAWQIYHGQGMSVLLVGMGTALIGHYNDSIRDAP